jgi:rod shape-determining protein MreD
MKGWKIALAAAISLWVAGGLQESVAPRLQLAGASFDFIIIVISVLGLAGDRRSASLVGFFGGVVQGGLTGANLGSYVISRTLTGFVCGSIASLEFERNPVVAGLMCAGMTLVAQVSLMFIAPPAAITPFLLATIGSALVNGVLAMPCHAVLRKFYEPSFR